jgi:hypothetical protein
MLGQHLGLITGEFSTPSAPLFPASLSAWGLTGAPISYHEVKEWLKALTLCLALGQIQSNGTLTVLVYFLPSLPSFYLIKFLLKKQLFPSLSTFGMFRVLFCFVFEVKMLMGSNPLLQESGRR